MLPARLLSAKQSIREDLRDVESRLDDARDRQTDAAEQVRDIETDIESWLVRGWKPAMREYVESIGARLREVVDLDLEEGFVELLRTVRAARS